MVGADAGSVVRLITARDDQVIFEVRTERPVLRRVTIEGRDYAEVSGPGLLRTGRAGEPDLPWAEVLLALPPGAVAIAAAVESSPELLATARVMPRAAERFVPWEQGIAEHRVPGREMARHEMSWVEDERIYAGVGLYPDQLLQTGRAHRWRHLRVAPVTVHPVRYEAQGEQIWWYPRILVQVTFVASGEPPDQIGIRQVPVYAHQEPRWERLYRSQIINCDRALDYRRRQLPRREMPRRADMGGPIHTAGSDQMQGVMAARTEAAFEARLAIDSTDVYSVSYSALLTAEIMPEEGWPWNELRLELRAYNDPEQEQQVCAVPFYEGGGDGDSLFELGETLVFYGEDAWDCFDLAPRDKRYLRRNIYWLVGGAGTGSWMEERPVWYGESRAPIPSFVRTAHFEENCYYMPVLSADEGRSAKPHGGPFDLTGDHFNWTHPQHQERHLTRPFKAVPLDLPALSCVTQLRVRLQGQRVIGGNCHQPRLWLSPTPNIMPGALEPADTAWAFPGNPYEIPQLDDRLVCLAGEDLAGSGLETGRTYMKIYLPYPGDGIYGILGDGVGIDWVEVTYEGRFALEDHQLPVTLEGLVGVQQLHVQGLATNDILVLDLTDPRRPVRIETESAQLKPVGGLDWELDFQVDCGNGSEVREVFVIEREHVVSLGAEEIMVKHHDLLTAFAGEDLVAIYPQRFEGALEPLLRHRESQGHRVYRAPVEDVFDAYSGGRRHPFAIKRLLRAMWRKSDPSPDYLLLVGDASNDNAGYSLANEFEKADTTYVPTASIPGHIASWGIRDIVSCDHWFVDNLAGPLQSDMDYYPFLHLGRIPCGSEEELTTYLEKVLAYEQSDQAASWRSRVVMLSDDLFSGVGSDYHQESTEDRFLRISRRSAGFIRADSIFDHYEIDSLYMAALMDSVPELGRCELDFEDSTRCRRDQCGQVVLRQGALGNRAYAANVQFGRNQVQERLLESLQDGALIWAFQGHSNRWQLTHEDIFEHWPWGAKDVFDLRNEGRPFVFMGFACHLADFAMYREAGPGQGDCLGEVMLFCCPGQQRAAVGVIGSGDYVKTGHLIQQHFFETMFAEPPVDEEGHAEWRLGELLSEGKLRLPDQDMDRITYTVLGDPALRIGIAPPGYGSTPTEGHGQQKRGESI